MQPAGDFVAAAAEFTTRVQNSQHYGNRRQAEFLVDADGYPAAVVFDGNDIPGQNFDVNVCTKTGQRLVNGIVDNFIDKVMKPPRTGRADVHARPFSDSFKAFQDLYLARVVFFGNNRIYGFNCRTVEFPVVQVYPPNRLCVTANVL